MKLISMTDFVLEQSKREVKIHGMLLEMSKEFQKSVKYADFLKQLLTLGMFVPCDKQGNIVSLLAPRAFTSKSAYDLNHKKYYEAKDRVLFEGCTSNISETFVHNKYVYYFYFQDIWYLTSKSGDEDYYTIEDIIHLGLTLTPTTIKKIGL